MNDDTENNYRKENPGSHIRSVYSFHFDKRRMIITSGVILMVIIGTFLIGMYIGGTDSHIYDNSSLGFSTNNESLEPEKNMGFHNEITIPDLDKGFNLLREKKGLNGNHPFNPNTNLKRSNNKLSLAARKRESIEILPLNSKSSLFKRSKSQTGFKKNSKRDDSFSMKTNKGRHKPASAMIRATSLSDDWEKNEFEKTEKNSRKRLSQNRLKRKTDRKGSLTSLEKITRKYPVKKGYQIQVASFKKIHKARRIRKKLMQIGIKGNISAKIGKRDIFYRVSFGAGKSLESLEQELVKVRSNRLFEGAFIIRM